MVVFFDDCPVAAGQPRSSYDRRHIAEILDPRYGVGGDNLLIVRPVVGSTTPFEIAGFDVDGSDVGMCGNGVRSVAQFLVDEGVIENSRRPSAESPVQFQIEGRQVSAHFLSEPADWISVELGKPEFAAERVPHTLRSVENSLFYHLVVGTTSYPVICLSVGNPHCVLFLEESEAISPEQIGPQIESHGAFPKGTNVEFVWPISETELKLRQWERRNGATYSSGSCTAAAFCAAQKIGLVETAATIFVKGGEFRAELDSGGAVHVAGPVKPICTGTLSNCLNIKSFLSSCAA